MITHLILFEYTIVLSKKIFIKYFISCMFVIKNLLSNILFPIANDNILPILICWLETSIIGVYSWNRYDVLWVKVTPMLQCLYLILLIMCIYFGQNFLMEHTLSLNMLNILNGLVPLPFLGLSIINFRDINLNI
jgi:hypothetical protein